MSYIEYEPRDFSADHQALINVADAIIQDYQGQGFKLTLRQLYYQFVARDILPNQDRQYKRLGKIVGDARMAGELPWDAIEDRGRWLRSHTTWESPADAVRTMAHWWDADLWKGQAHRVEVWIEKDALVGVIQPICNELQLPFFSCRGYSSATALWEASQRIQARYSGDEAQDTIILLLTDHDPSGVDMERDIDERLERFLAYSGAQAASGVRRIALTMEQIEALRPPPNPAKVTDSRAKSYLQRFGEMSWELDALEPAYISGLIREHAQEFIGDWSRWEARERFRDHGRRRLEELAAQVETEGRAQ